MNVRMTDTCTQIVKNDSDKLCLAWLNDLFSPDIAVYLVSIFDNFLVYLNDNCGEKQVVNRIAACVVNERHTNQEGSEKVKQKPEMKKNERNEWRNIEILNTKTNTKPNIRMNEEIVRTKFTRY